VTRKLLYTMVVGFGFTGALTSKVEAKWWNSDWTIRKKITIDTTAKGIPTAQPIESMVILVRLHDGNFQFSAGKEDGSDLRFIAADEKTLLTYHIEKFDSLLGEAFVWVRVPDLKPDSSTTISLYYGNTGGTAIKAENVKATFDGDTVLVYHFAEKGGPPNDSSPAGNNGQGTGVPAEGSMIGTGLRLVGKGAVTVPASPSLAWAQGGEMTWAAWLKPAAIQPKAIMFARQEENNRFLIGMDRGVPFVDLNGQRTEAGPPVAANSWHHVAVTAAGGKITLYLDGEPYGGLAAALPALNSPLSIGGGTASGGDGDGFVGEMDELEISKVARSAEFIRVKAVEQGGDKANKLITYGTDEQHTTWFSGGGTISVLVSSLTLDGWIVIVVLALMACMSWWVMVTKIRYLNEISKGNALFMKEWKRVADDLTVLDEADAVQFRSMGGETNNEARRAMRNASVYHIYHLGVEEIRHRLAADNAAEGTRKGLAGRSIQAIRATLDGGLVRETQKINRLIVLLTICISGGPFLGLLGTVIGVMITFAAIAAAGDVNVNAIAPGIAAALLATVAGLAVAIPALFGYNYIITRVKDAKDDMVIFIDEFVTKTAEFYRETPAPQRSRSDLFQESIN
jgi:biopolymer transport protein ExbB